MVANSPLDRPRAKPNCHCCGQQDHGESRRSLGHTSHRDIVNCHTGAARIEQGNRNVAIGNRGKGYLSLLKRVRVSAIRTTNRSVKYAGGTSRTAYGDGQLWIRVISNIRKKKRQHVTLPGQKSRDGLLIARARKREPNVLVAVGSRAEVPEIVRDEIDVRTVGSPKSASVA